MKRLLFVLFLTIFLSGCGLFVNEIDCSPGFHEDNGLCVEDVHQAGTFTSDDDLITLFNTFQERQSLMWQFNGWMFLEGDLEATDDAPASDEKGSDDYSETNNQVEGVDEMDNVLTDGKYMYISNYDKIQIVLAYTVESGIDVLDLVKEISFTEFQQDDNPFYFNGMYVDDDRLLVVGNSYYNTCSVTYEEKYPDSDEGEGDYHDECWYYEYHTTTHIMEYSKDDFTLLNEYELSGNFVGSRKIGDSLYFVTNEYIPFYRANNEEFDFSVDNYLPYYNVNGTTVSLDYEDILYVEGTEPRTFTNFYGINLDTKEVSTEVVLGEGGYNLYVSVENIYLTGTKWSWNDAVLLEMEEAAENDETYEVDEDPYNLSTSILKIAINNGVVEYAANGEVDGIALDQFAMDERDGYVRIVTSGQNWWWWGWGNDRDVNNRLFILDQNLDIVSTLEHIGKEGETVQSVRFAGDYAYVVTFLRTDPFYVIDVSDPENPEKLSELEIPGFSDYLQPIGEDYILGIGYGDNDGGTSGLKISLYDVSDKSNAVVASEVIYPYSEGSYMWTSTVYNHKDLLVSIAKGIIALPYTENTYTETNGYYWSYQTGVLVLNLDLETGTISERGRVLHSESSSWDNYVYKSKFISDYLYTISSQYIKVSTIADPETILNQIQIGEGHEMDIPTEVEPD